MDELKWIADEAAPRTMTAPAPVAAGRKNWLKTALWVGAAVAACIVVGLAVWYLKPTPARPDSRAVRFFVSAPETWSLEEGGSALVGPVGPAGPAALLVSPDGHQIAFAATSAEGKTLLWVRSLDTLAAQALCDSGDGLGGTWSRDGVIVFATGISGLQKVSASGGVPTAATALGAGEAGHRRPFFLPDSRHFLYFAAARLGTPGGGSVYVSSLDSAERKLLKCPLWPALKTTRLPSGDQIDRNAASGPNVKRVGRLRATSYNQISVPACDEVLTEARFWSGESSRWKYDARESPSTPICFPVRSNHMSWEPTAPSPV